MMTEKREPLIKALDDYYTKLGRTNTPAYHNYSLIELKKCVRMFGISLSDDKISADIKWRLPKP